MAEAKRLQRVQEHDVQLPGEPAVLEAIVQDDQLAAELCDGLVRGREAVGILQVGHVGKQPPHLQRLVVRLACGCPIAAADHRHPHAALLEPSGDPLDQGGFAGAAEGEVADAYDRHAEAMHHRRATVIPPVPPADGCRVARLADPQRAAQQVGPGARRRPLTRSRNPAGLNIGSL